MKNFVLFLSLFSLFFGFSQSLPITFEGDVTTTDFVDFDGGTATVTANPLISGINNSNSVARIVRDGGAVYAGSKILLSDNLDFSVLTKISMKVYTTAPAGTIVKFKLEGSGPSVEVDALTTVSGSWETLEWIFVGTANNLNEIVFMFDFGNVGDGTANSTFYFDDIQQITGPPAPIPASLPIDFETGIVSSDFLNFSGSTASIIPNPQMNGINTSNTVCQIIRDGGEFFAGSKIFLTNNLDFSSMWHISMKIYTTAPVGTRIKLELESANGRTNLDYLTTTTGQWETASWNFDGASNDYNRLIFMFDFGNVGNGTATSTFLFDDVQQIAGPAIPDPAATSLPVDFESSVVTSDFSNVFGAITSIIPNPQMDTDNPSATVGQFVRSGGAPWAQSKLVLTDFMDYSVLSSISMKVYTDAPVGTLLKFKVESTASGAANERNVLTTVSGAWETYYWDFAGDPPVYNVLTLMLGYATPNDASPNATFLFDDIEQTTDILSDGNDSSSNIDGVNAYPNPAKNYLTINAENKTIKTIALFDILGNQVTVLHPNSRNTTIDVANFASGVYIAKILTETGVGSIKLIIE
ncbi:Por secretion system C-terminal sorting domain-containing protein [Formosa sp. Hel1_31_208]|uniref:T9SS type A sorting domain-containing protein n=1 Tax=Formosa sp. Hel1_31_208 TaxID=1798225 RepID=UPI00087AEAE6|nr:T9SS type A sorting domain-containing protein [Formosa sp. Hel1_31_208]SDS41395.1 Por secretion system C-terminal sorting domain-containing protein [Formosa sp. Hel1_31_208]